MKRPLALWASGVLLAISAQLVGERAARAKNAHADPDELMYLPEGSVLSAASLGHRSILADVIWLRAIQYYGEHRLTDRNYDQAERLFHVIYDLDPSFKGATRFGALVLAQDARNPDAALALLRRAERDAPHVWEYPFDQGFIQQTVVCDLAAAGESYRRASRLPGAPPVAARLAGTSFGKLGDRESAREVWTEILDGADNKMMSAVAVRNLKTLDMEEAEEILTGAVEKFGRERGRPPAEWDELVAAGLLERIPGEPFGGRFFLDPQTGKVWASTHIDRKMAIVRDIIEMVASEVHEMEGAYPRSVEELFERGLIDALPWEPFGLALEYDPARGCASWNPPWPPTEERNHGSGRG
jgi:tetratricopeptide (TPR) repeat protein